MSLRQSLRLGIDVEEKVTWGMDLCTAVNFMTICPHDLPAKSKSTPEIGKGGYSPANDIMTLFQEPGGRIF